jgi:predicted ATPase with chaperone activity
LAQRVEHGGEAPTARGYEANADLPGSEIDRWAPLTAGATTVLERHLRAGWLSARGLHRVRRVARTLADLEDEEGARRARCRCTTGRRRWPLRAARATLGIEVAR